MGTQSPTPKGAERHPIFGPRLLWASGCMDEDATWYGGIGLGLRDIVFDEDQLPPEKRHTHHTQLLAHVYCGQMAGWMKVRK